MACQNLTVLWDVYNSCTWHFMIWLKKFTSPVMKMTCQTLLLLLNTLGQRQNGRYFPDDIFECIYLKENVWIPIIISLKFVPKSPINNIPALVHIMAWRQPGYKPLSEPMMVRLPTYICVTRPQWIKRFINIWYDMWGNISNKPCISAASNG